jgi:hypothetical protein
MRSFGLKVSIIDINAENLDHEEVLSRIKSLNLRLVLFVVYGKNLNNFI